MKLKNKLAMWIALSMLFITTIGVSLVKGQFGWQLRIVQTASMGTALPAGSLALVERNPLAVGLNDIAMYSTNKMTITHRLIKILPAGLLFKGDTNQIPDSLVNRQNVIGRVAWHIEKLGFVLKFIASPLGLVLFVYAPTTIVIANELYLLKRRSYVFRG